MEKMTVPDRILAHGLGSPDRLAVVQGDQKLTFADLRSRVEGLTDLLRMRGIGIGEIVGVCLPPSPDLVVLLLAIMRTGAAYAPLDVSYPRQRLETMVSSLAEMRYVVVAHSTAPFGRSAPIEHLDFDDLLQEALTREIEAPAFSLGQDDLCYAVFTSGTTGVPKATAVYHSGWFNLLSWFESHFRLDHHSSNLLVSAFGFDISQRSLMAPLFCGATLYLLPSLAFDPFLARKEIRRNAIRTLHLAPSTLYLLLETDDGDPTGLDSLHYAFIGGEALVVRRVADWALREAHRCNLVHQYGTAECADVTTSHTMVKAGLSRARRRPAGISGCRLRSPSSR